MKNIVLLVAILATFAAPASAQERPRLNYAAALLAVEQARTAMNEAGGSEADLIMIHNIVLAEAGENVHARRSWLRSHSPCATGVLTQAQADRRPGNCRWTRNLMPVQRQPPEGFPRPDLWNRTQERWGRQLRLSLRLVAGIEAQIVCAEQPETWDGPRGVEGAIARGWRQVDCKGTRNNGYVRAREEDGPLRQPALVASR
jgi:hypothetical protein